MRIGVRSRRGRWWVSMSWPALVAYGWLYLVFNAVAWMMIGMLVALYQATRWTGLAVIKAALLIRKRIRERQVPAA